YMVPSAFVLLDQLPLTTNNKVDRKALPAPDTDRPELGEQYVAPHTPVQQIVARIWTDILGIDRIGIHDNFFELGGDSILTIQVISRAKRYGLHLTPPMLFQHPTVEELSAHALPDTGVTSVEHTDVPATAYQQALLDAADDPDRASTVRLIATPALDPDLLRRALTAVIGHHDALRLRFGPEADGRRMTTAAEEAGELAYHDLTDRTEDDGRAQMATVCQALRAGLDPSGGPLLHGAVFDIGENRARHLLLVAHRLAVDEESWPILLTDLDLAYQALAAGRDVVLPLKSTPFTAWAAHLADGTRTYRSSPTARVMARVERSESGSLTAGSTDERRARLAELALDAVESAVGDWAGGPHRVELAASGRERSFNGMDLTRTVGCLLRPAGDGGDRPAVVLTIAEPPGPPPAGLGENTELLLPGSEFVTPVGMRFHPVEVTAELQDGSLSFELAYATDTYTEESIEALTRSLRSHAADRLNETSGPSRPSVSANSFPHAGLDEAGLASVLERFSR
ncbi:condensation domain-containing protein, partial [Kitasatospora sp. NPDC127067]|uniref:condensation domain-containing protein n=1 Tax=Kitasatospora sp. NPDC127067 TaxID=3347126 RepID=UPI0036579A34